MHYTNQTHSSEYEFDFGLGITSRNGWFKRRARANAGNEVVENAFEYFLDDSGLVQPLAVPLPARYADFVDIAVAANLADRRAPRRRGSEKYSSLTAASTWWRNMHLSIPVRDQYWWNSETVKRDLARLLRFLTGDVWSLQFYERKIDPRPSEIQSAFKNFIPNKSNVAILHSGGMDALFGMTLAGIHNPGAGLVAISSISHERIRSVQHSVLTGLRESRRHEWLWLQHKLNVVDSKSHLAERESSQRSRGFLYLAIGAIAADMAGCSELQLSENGVGAIGLPYAPDQAGALTNKSAHPWTLMLFERLFNRIAESPLRVTNPSLWWTKSELATAVSNQSPYGLGSTISQTVSCDRLPWYSADQACGTCSSCASRKMVDVAIPDIEIDNLSWRRYDFDPLVGPADWSRPALVAYGAIQVQAAILRRALSGMLPYENLREQFPDLSSVEACATQLHLSSEELQERIVRLYRKHIAEVDMLVAAFPQPDGQILEGMQSTPRTVAS